VASTRYSVSHQVLVKISKISSQREIWILKFSL
jgi:hypothetical protein